MKERFSIFFPPESNEIYCICDFFLHEKNGLLNQGLGFLFCPIYHAFTTSNMGNYKIPLGGALICICI
jgi:hypothetical protein